MLRAWTFVIVGLNLSLLFLALLVAGSANSLGVSWRAGFIAVGVVYLLFGAGIIALVLRGGRSALLEEIGASLIFAGSVCLILAAFLPWLESKDLFPFESWRAPQIAQRLRYSLLSARSIASSSAGVTSYRSNISRTHSSRADLRGLSSNFLGPVGVQASSRMLRVRRSGRE
jgi:hypothetical protein